MIKNKTIIEHKIGERIYEFHCTPDTPLGEGHDAACYFKAFFVDQIKQAQDKETNSESKP